MFSDSRPDASQTGASAATGRAAIAARTTPGRSDRKGVLLAALKSACRDGSCPRLARLEGWAASFEPCDFLEECVLDQIVRYAEWLDEVRTARTAGRRLFIILAGERERLEAGELGDRLLIDPRGRWGICSPARFSRSDRDSRATVTDPAREPAALVKSIEATTAGCEWLLGQWAKLRADLEWGNMPNSPRNFIITHLMGKRLVDAIEDPELSEVFLASHALDPWERNAFAELRSLLRNDEIKERLSRMRNSAAPGFNPRNPEEGRKRLFSIIERAEARLRAMAEEHRKRSESGEAEAAWARAFDESPKGQSLEHAARSYAREISAGIANLRNHRREYYSERK
jgi:hypothetical protein